MPDPQLPNPPVSVEINVYNLRIEWAPRDSNCILALLLGNIAGSDQWAPILTQPVSGNNGEIEVGIGKFKQKRTINLQLVVHAATKIENITIDLINDTLGLKKRLIPNTGSSKKIEANDSLSEVITVQLF